MRQNSVCGVGEKPYFYCILLLLTLIDVAAGLISDADVLHCGFEQDCPGWNGTNPDGNEYVPWTVAPSLILDSLHSIPRPIKGSYFAYIRGSDLSGTPQTAWLISQPLSCLSLPGYLTFYFWKNAFLSGLFRPNFPILRVYMRNEAGDMSKVADFSSTNQWGWRFGAVELPGTKSPFQIVIEAVIDSLYDIIAIDDINLKAFLRDEFCDDGESIIGRINDSNNSTKEKAGDLQAILTSAARYRQALAEYRKNQSEIYRPVIPVVESKNSNNGHKNTSPTWERFLNPQIDAVESAPQQTLIDDDASDQFPPILFNFRLGGNNLTQFNQEPIQEKCAAVFCDFEIDSCGYEGTDSEQGSWVVMQGSIGGSFSGIKKAAVGGRYAVAFTNTDQSNAQVLRSRQFSTLKPTVLQFCGLSRMVVCDVELDNCVWQNPALPLNQWQRTQIQLRPGKHRILFVVENLEPNHYAGLDDVRLAHVEGGRSQDAQCIQH